MSDQIPFTQFLLPNREPILRTFTIKDPDMAKKAGRIVGLGLEFHCELTHRGKVRLAIHDPIHGYDLVVRHCRNGTEELVERVDDLILGFDQRKN